MNLKELKRIKKILDKNERLANAVRDKHKLGPSSNRIKK